MRTKRFKFTFLLLLLATMGVMTSCVQDDDFETPDLGINPPDIDGEVISISAVKDILRQAEGENGSLNGSEQHTFQDTDLYMKGYVISSDEAGNFYQEMVLQDKAENPTSGIKILVDANPLYTKYEIGRQVYVELDGFTIGFSNGIIALGITRAGSDYVDNAPKAFADKILRTPEMDTIVPLEVQIADFSRQYDNMFVKLTNVEFPAEIALGTNAKSFAGESDDEYDAQRALESCNGGTTSVSTSTFSDFKSMALPTKMGSLSGVLMKTFDGSEYVIKLNSPEDIHFDQPRCDGENPGTPSEPGDPSVVSIPFSEDFEGLTDYDPINFDGWTNQDVSGSSRVWEARSFDSNGYAQMSAFQASGMVETWLVTPGLDLSTVSSAVLSFETKDGHYNGDALTVYVSTDFDGDASTATWTPLTNVTLAQGHSSGYAPDFIASGNVDLSSYIGQTVYVGFKYKGSDSGITTTFQLDNVSVTESGASGGGSNGLSLPFTEDFSGQTAYEAVTVDGWSNIDVTGSTYLWEAREYNSNFYAQMSAFQATGAVETWLVSPALDLTSVSAASLSFSSKDGHYNGDALTVYVSTDFSGNAAAATWTPLTGITLSNGHANGYGPSFVPSGDVDLSSFAGETIYIGFKYVGDANGVTSTYQIDDIAVVEN